MLSVLSDLAASNNTTTYYEILHKPQIPVTSFPFIPPPRWATELSRLLHKSFPDIPQKHHGRFLQVFVHPSFTTSAGASGTMLPLIPIGEALLEKIGGLWILSTFEGIKREEYTSLLALLMSDTALCRVLRDHWGMEHMVLTDASADLFSKERLNSSKGMVRWLAAQGTAGRAQALPEPYAAGCVKAMVSAILLEHGYDTAHHFVTSEILPYLL
ncbi:hypothetical protein ABB37_04351 [Leptomonas pyrrhocoris]|uniref:Uncharacterized protein n=1 Tax=Leptomonas pyrrhocoris TaxID=157538 RepID=A0A0M9G2L3_LEPPY|nr:hypothetical protein ABB37_04351 [Leptomonas pyrrhocoris]XP_015659401.1 hypothetical protein ABB37_04351 [Leptomonas pyrrhocoris]XP_015659402.1 hypothetical protein ABB37_04351 [Leptomonas pyrrhocoris]KPA80961.1 hypothetical protein ABB37_04351 [Leptomonas pyrrhocoris]KPA80962.1 hypothetical protein ABB37_04351 [Leptomonas pyrrhocoris]KPA80963.1 hypothetical protein ABB37_04351 [Leptomonas pyrrhocoris]|eukprot:XP_015659400.1 hypothetical protein ABB37_04351 [Leptomonas pyrrhocoris]